MLAIVVALACWASSGAAQTFTATASSGLSLGNVAAAKTGDTVFRIDPATGSVIRVSGTAARTSSSPARATVTITCTDVGAPGSCATTNVAVLVGPTGTPTGRARALTNFKVSMGTASLVGATSGTSPVAFTLAPVGLGAGKTFFVGADFGIAGDNSGLPSGSSQSAFYAYVGAAPNPPTSGTVGFAGATVFRALSITKTSDLVFGGVGKPNTGSGTVTLDAATGLRTNTGGGSLMPTPLPKLAAFTVTGEGGQVFSISVQSNFTLAGPTPLTVTTNNTAGGLNSFGGALGTQGSFSFMVGGSFPYSSTTQEGSYTGSFTVTADYN